MIFSADVSLYKSGAITPAEIVRDAKILIELSDPQRMQEYMLSIAERAVLEILQYLINNADRFDHALEFLLSLQPGRYPIDPMDTENIVYKVYDAIDAVDHWLHHLNLLTKMLGKPEIKTALTYNLPDGTKITVFHRPAPRIVIETKNQKKDIFVNDQSWSYPECPAMHVCIS